MEVERTTLPAKIQFSRMPPITLNQAACTFNKKPQELFAPPPQAVPESIEEGFNGVGHSTQQTSSNAVPTSNSANSSLKLEALMSQERLPDNKDLVSALNAATFKEQRQWIEAAIQWFDRQQIATMLPGAIQDYAALAHIRVDEDNKILLQKYFFSVFNKIKAGAYGDKPLIQAVAYMLEHSDAYTFSDSVSSLLQLTQDLLNKLQRNNNAFIKDTFQTDRITLEALCQTIFLVQQVNPGKLDKKEGGLYNGLQRKIQNIANGAAFYPVRFHAQSLEQALKLLAEVEEVPKRKLVWNGCRAVLHCLRGGVYLYQSVNRLVPLDPLGLALSVVTKNPLQGSYDEFKSSYEVIQGLLPRSENGGQRMWYHHLIGIQYLCTKISQNDSISFEHLKCYLNMQIGLLGYQPRGTEVSQQDKALRFGIALQLKAMAISGPTPIVRKETVMLVIKLAQPQIWGSDKDVLEELLDSLAQVVAYSNITSEQETYSQILEFVRKYKGDQWLSARVQSLRQQLATQIDIAGQGDMYRYVKELLPMSAATACKALKSHYSEQKKFQEVSSFFPEDPKTSMKTIQCHMMLLEQIPVKERPQENEENQVAAIEELLRWVKNPIALQDIFKARRIQPGGPIKEVKKVLLVGEAGTGKTTLSRKLVHDWVQGSWGAGFAAVYLLSVRNLRQDTYNGSSSQTAQTIGTAIVRECFSARFGENETDFKRLRSQITAQLQQPTTLVILDGMDERAGVCEAIISQAKASNAPYKLLMLSRPYGISLSERQEAEIEIENQGFDDAQVDSFVQNYFLTREVELQAPAGSLSAQLQMFIREYASRVAIFHVPVNLEILCALWCKDQQGVREATRQGSLPALYRELTRYMWDRFANRYQGDKYHHLIVSEKMEGVFEALGQIALQSLKQGDVSISKQQVREPLEGAISEAMLKDSGLLQADGVGHYQFPHLTFQEYFAGRYLAKHFISARQKDVPRLLSQCKYEGQYARALQFMAGEIGRTKDVLDIVKLLDLLGKSPTEALGVQNTILKLRITHEWLCIANLSEDMKEDIDVLQQKFEVIASLQKWFDDALQIVRKGLTSRDEDLADKAGIQLLDILTKAMSQTNAVLTTWAQVLQPLHNAAKDEIWQIRRAAVGALGNFELADYKSVQVLHQAVKDKHWQVRGAAFAALRCLRVADANAVSVLHEAAEDDDWYVRRAAATALGNLRIANNSDSVRILHKSVRDKYWRVRGAAAAALGNLRASDGNSVKVLHKAASDKYRKVRSAAIEALGNIGVADIDSQRVLLDALRDEYGQVRLAASEAMRNCGLANADSVRVVIYALGDADAYVRGAAAEALSSLRIADSDSIKVLQNAVTDENMKVCLGAVEALGNLGVADAVSVSILQTAARNKNWQVRCAAIAALCSLGVSDTDTQNYLLTAVGDKQGQVRLAAINCLLKLRLVDAYLVRVLRQAGGDYYWQVRHAAYTALGDLADVDADSISVLHKAVKEESGRARGAAIAALGNLRRADADSLAVLHEAATDKIAYVRREAVEALGKLGQADADSVRVLHEVAKDEDWSVRRAAIVALGSLAVVNGDSLKILREAVSDEIQQVRAAAREALLHGIPLEQLVDGYWVTRSELFVRYIVYRLFGTPLVIENVQVTLYLRPGETKVWHQGKDISVQDIERFKNLIQKSWEALKRDSAQLEAHETATKTAAIQSRTQVRA